MARSMCATRHAAAERAGRVPITATRMRLPPDDRDWLDGIEDGVRGAAYRLQPRSRLCPRRSRRSPRLRRRGARQFEALGALVEEVGDDLPVAARCAADPLGRRRGARAGRLPGRAAPSVRPRPGRDGGARRATSASVEYLGADMARTALGIRMGEFHQRYDLLLTPMMPVPALPVGQDLNDPAGEGSWFDWSPFSYPFNYDAPAGRLGAVRADQRRACRSACRSSDRFMPRTACCAPRAPSRRPGPSGARR